MYSAPLSPILLSHLQSFASSKSDYPNLHTPLFSPIPHTIHLTATPITTRIPFPLAKALKYTQFQNPIGKAWETRWFKLELEYQPLESILEFNPNAEALIFSESGKCEQGITGGTNEDKHVHYTLKGEKILYIEVACNGMFGNSDGYGAPDENR